MASSDLAGAGPARVAAGLLIDATQPVRFRFDGRELQGLRGDTLASALLANGARVIARSFKYHRPRGIVSAGPEEPCGLVDVVRPERREPNRLSTQLPISAGLRVASQNRWPTLRFDIGALADRVGSFLPAGFYYKTFMAPGWAWERVYEPLIRRAAGLGVLDRAVPEHELAAEVVHQHTDVLVVGAGAAGMAASVRLARSGLRVILAEQDVALGGGTLLDAHWSAWRERQCSLLAQLPSIGVLTRTAVIGAYGHGVFGALETVRDDPGGRAMGPAVRLRVIRARRVLLATGACERLIAFPGNDVPGVMLAGAALAYLRRYGVAVGRRPVVFTNNDEAYESVLALAAAGVGPGTVVDVRAGSLAADRARAAGIRVLPAAVVAAVIGRCGVRQVEVRDRSGTRRRLRADCLLMSGGRTPLTSLATQLGGVARWDAGIAAFTVELSSGSGELAGAVRGLTGLAAAARDGERAATALLLSLTRSAAAADAADESAVTPPPDAEMTPLEPLWEVSGNGKAFVDLQNDVTTADVRLAAREGYEHIEHMKRYTTHGMAVDQGRIGGLVGSAVLAAARGLPVAQVGVSNPRPFAAPVPFAALAGGEVRAHFKPKRRLPLHAWHEAAGATFVSVGLWLRPLVYSRQGGWEPVLAEARAVRRSVGVTDVSTLGKIDLQGPDAARFLDFIYANRFSTLPVGRARYGIMLREDGMLLDDGTTSRLAAEHFLVTTTTANAAAVLEHLEFHLQSSCRGWDVVLSDVSDHWAQFALAGPRAREVLARVAMGIEVSNTALPFMGAAPARLAGIAGRVFRISFSGELAFELAVPARHAVEVWSALLEAGKPFGLVPYGLDALNTLRIEKGHVTGAELNGNTSADDLGFGRMLKPDGDFIGRALSRREGLQAPGRLQLVGVRPVNDGERLRNGAQLVTAAAPDQSLGYITSSTPAVELPGWVGLALLSSGRQRIGARLLAVSPVHGERTEVSIVSPHMLDPENVRVRA